MSVKLGKVQSGPQVQLSMRVIMRVLRKALLGFLLLASLAVVGIAALGFGWVPLFGFDSFEDYFGEHPQSWVAWYATGWTDHRLYMIFKAEPDWVARAAKYAYLEQVGMMSRDECLASFSTPWWFALASGTQGSCWARRDGYAGNLRMHVAPDSGFIYVFDYST